MHRPLQRLFPLITQIFFKFPDCHYHPLSHPCPFPRVTCVHVNTPFYFSPFQLCLFCLCDLRIHTKHPQRCVRCKKLRCRQRYALADGQVDETILFVQRREWEGMWQRVRGLLAENFVDVRRKSGINARGGDICVGSRHGVIRSSCELRPGVIRGSHSGHTSGSSDNKRHSTWSCRHRRRRRMQDGGMYHSKPQTRPRHTSSYVPMSNLDANEASLGPMYRHLYRLPVATALQSLTRAPRTTHDDIIGSPSPW